MGRHIYCSKCRKEKEPNRENESYCKPCKRAAISRRYYENRFKNGFLPRKNGRTTEVCKIDACKSRVLAKDLCVKHYQQMHFHGKTFISRKEVNDYLDKDSFHRNYLINEVTGCWEWSRHIEQKGYGVLIWKGKSQRAHRFSYKLHKGQIPEGLNVCHHCDNPKCVNPKHLFLGTAKDNSNDRDMKNRQAKGFVIKKTLTEEQVLDIKAKLKSGVQGLQISQEFNVSPKTISHIKMGRTWKHVGNA